MAEEEKDIFIKFHFSEKQLSAFNEWAEKRNPNAYSGAIGGRYSNRFLTPCVGKQISYIVDSIGDVNENKIILTDLFDESLIGAYLFSLDERETRECREWMERRLSDGMESNERFEVSFTFTTLGGVTKIKDLVNTSGESELDVTDYDW